MDNQTKIARLEREIKQQYESIEFLNDMLKKRDVEIGVLEHRENGLEDRMWRIARLFNNYGGEPAQELLDSIVDICKSEFVMDEEGLFKPHYKLANKPYFNP